MIQCPCRFIHIAIRCMKVWQYAMISPYVDSDNPAVHSNGKYTYVVDLVNCQVSLSSYQSKSFPGA